MKNGQVHENRFTKRCLTNDQENLNVMPIVPMKRKSNGILNPLTPPFFLPQAISLLGGNDVAQQAVKQEAAPALMEFSKGLTGAHPHCLQRVLCRLTSHASQLSLLPRVALQMLR